ncbi:hypothetical protein FQZ97_723380 [compost metagenome]
MSSRCTALNADTALSYLGQTVIMELGWDDDPEPVWRCLHVLGVVLPKEGVYEHGHFMVLNALNPDEFPHEIFWANIRTLQTVHDRTEVRPAPDGLIRSGAALPARRNRISVPANGSTGEAHP